MKQSEKIDLSDPSYWQDWAEDQLHLLAEDERQVIADTGKYQGSAAKAQALIRARDVNSGRTR